MHALDPASGSQKWSFTTGGSLDNSPAVDAAGVIYTGTDYLYALFPNGSLWYKYNIHGTISQRSTYYS